ncbi:SusE domain-containing protein [Sediminibacter sp. Hel_I_10]|uniref:SusE domain-containing protein n=1 Tax=Sediminibacter sp. Hel_I_10 TaxID=1392490 RepID=UPI0009DFEC45|nr:SusE domain-containing protein [Sediminibacter sp. Hel_I_10]
MKFTKFSALILSLFFVFMACEKDETLETSSPEAQFKLLEPTISNINLNYNLPDNPAMTIVWDNPLSSGTDGYVIELSSDNSFESPMVVGTSTTDRFTMTVSEFNNTVLGAGADAFEPFTVYLRVTSGSLVSNSVSFSVSSYSEALPIITSPDNSFNLVLLETTPNDTAISMSWEDPDFGENSSVVVSYDVQFAQGGTNFETIITETAGNDTSLEFTHEAFNDIVLNAGLAAEEAGSLDFRVRASIMMDGGNMERISEPVTITVTPYSVELSPILYVVGAGAADAGWSWDNPVELPLQGTVYSGNINLINDAFRFFTEATNWDTGLNYPYYEAVGYTIDSNLVNAMDGDNNFQFTGTPGEYFIQIDTVAKTITLSPPVVGPNCNFDQLYLVGAGTDAGWSWDNPVSLPCTGNGTYSGNVTFSNDAFRFFTVNNNWDSGTNYPGYEGSGYTIDSNFTNAMDGDSNFFFNGTPGTYFLTVDDINKTITLEAEQLTCEFEQLWLVGAGIVDAGWSWDTPVALPCTGAGIYSGQVALQNDAFRFFTINSNWDTGINYPTYEGNGYTIDPDLINALDGDSNFLFDGTPGTYTITVDTVNLTISVD